jgi:cardiolipin synthase
MIAMKTAVWVLLGIIHLTVIVRAILLEGRDSYSRAAWLLLLIALPGVATLLYLLFGEPWISAKFRKRSSDAYEALLVDVRQDEDEAFGSPESANAFRTCAAAARWSASAGNRARVAPEGDAAIDLVVTDIDAATSTVHLSFYIWLGDGNGTKVVEAVRRAAKRGVTCRIVADAIGSRAMVRSDQWRQMGEDGATMCASLSVPFGLGFLAGHRTDLRNHRKIVVIDGDVTWSGSQNCADPAFLPKRKFAPWVDILVRYEGPVARQAERIFASAWMAETGEDMRPVMSVDRPRRVPDGIAAIAVGTGPMSPHATMTDIFVATLAAAQKQATITTPYFAPDPPLLDAIVATARRGVALTIVFPQRNDSRIVGAISRAYYPTLAKAGARIFEFRSGLLHAKTLVVDGRLALVGSSNMDRRSLDLNFENNVLFESEEVAAEVEEHQRRWLADAVEIDHDGVATRSLPRRFIDNLLTMAAPLF